MYPRLIRWFGCGLLLTAWLAARTAQAQDVPSILDISNSGPAADQPAASGDNLPSIEFSLPGEDDRPVKALAEGPLHEAFLSPSRAEEPTHVDRSPPPPLTERPAVDPPSVKARWIDGYWEWDAHRNDFTWVTGTWRIPPPGRFWVDGYWKRDEQGWYRVPGFWSDRRTDRIDYRKEGPPADHPDEKIDPAPGEDYFYVPGHYEPDGDGVAWKKGFWSKAHDGWAWVPAQWVKQPEGWVYEEGYWDRTLEDRGTLFSPATVQDTSNVPDDLVYQPLSQIAPASYGRLYGAFGRPTSYYDGYPGCYFDPYGRYYGYARYGTIGLYTGYLDYPYTSYYGYPYLTSAPYGYSPFYGGLGYGGYGGYGYGGGLLSGLLGYGGYGFGLGGLFGGYGYGYGYPSYGYGGFGYPFGGYGFGYPYYGGYGFGYGFGYPYYGFGFPFFGFGGFPFLFGGLNNNFRHHNGHHPYYPGPNMHPPHRGNGNGQHHGGMPSNLAGHGGRMGNGVGNGPWVPGGGRPGLGGGSGNLMTGLNPAQHRGAGQGGTFRHASMPPASSPFANPLPGSHRNGLASMPTGAQMHHNGALGVASGRNAVYNGGHQAAMVRHVAARPAWNNTQNGALGALNHANAGGLQTAPWNGATNHLRGTIANQGGLVQRPAQLHNGAGVLHPGGANLNATARPNGMAWPPAGGNAAALNNFRANHPGAAQALVQQHHAAGMNPGLGGLSGGAFNHPGVTVHRGAVGGLGGMPAHVGAGGFVSGGNHAAGLGGLGTAPMHYGGFNGAPMHMGGFNAAPMHMGGFGGGMPMHSGGFGGFGGGMPMHHGGFSGGSLGGMHHGGGFGGMGGGFGGHPGGHH